MQAEVIRNKTCAFRNSEMFYRERYLVQSLYINIIMQKGAYGLRSAQKLSNGSNKSHHQFEAAKVEESAFRQTNIITRYHNLQKQQYDQLSTINMNEILKRKLFRFSEASYLVNPRTSDDLVIQSHPIKGRIIMAKQQYENYHLTKNREALIHADASSEGIMSQAHIQEQHIEDASLKDFRKSSEYPHQFLKSSQQLITKNATGQPSKGENPSIVGNLTDDRLIHPTTM